MLHLRGSRSLNIEDNKNSVLYFALLHQNDSGNIEAGGLIRRVETEDELRLERLAFPDGEWIEDEHTLAPYFAGREGGMAAVSSQEAMQLRIQLLGYESLIKSKFSESAERNQDVESRASLSDMVKIGENSFAGNGNRMPETLGRTRELCARLDELVTAYVSEEESLVQIRNATALMLDLHGDQKSRPDGQPYVNHPLEVAILLIDSFKVRSPSTIVAALLHDSLEDQAAKMALRSTLGEELPVSVRAREYIRRNFGTSVEELVSEVTNPDFDSIVNESIPHSSPQERRAEKNMLYFKHVESIFDSDSDALLIKIGDLSFNALQLNEVSDQKRRSRLFEKYEPVITLLKERLTNAKPDERIFKALSVLEKIQALS